jgi:hypothetical protein
MLPANNLSRLPDELIIDIFRNRILSRGDLYNCCLVSRRFTKEVNECLYEEVAIILSAEVGGTETGQGMLRSTGSRTRYSVKSWRLIRTLVDKPELARHVRTVYFVTWDRDDDEGEESRTVDTTETLAWSTTLDLAMNLKSIDLGRWFPSNLDWNPIKLHQTLNRLELTLVSPEVLQFIAQHLPRIKHLTGMLDADGSTPLLPKGLESLNLYAFHNVLETSLVLANCSTLRSLEIPLEVGLDLDFSLFPNLDALHLGSATNSSSVSKTEARSSGRKLWDSLPKAPSLRTLSFDDCKYGGAYEEALFPSVKYPPGGPSKAIPALRTIRFRGNIILDRANILLTRPIATTLQRVLIPSTMLRESAGPLLTNRAEFVMAICKKKGIEVIFADA